MSIQKPLTAAQKARQEKDRKTEAKRRANMTPAQKKAERTFSKPAPTPKTKRVEHVKRAMRNVLKTTKSKSK